MLQAWDGLVAMAFVLWVALRWTYRWVIQSHHQLVAQMASDVHEDEWLSTRRSVWRERRRVLEAQREGFAEVAQPLELYVCVFGIFAVVSAPTPLVPVLAQLILSSAQASIDDFCVCICTLANAGQTVATPPCIGRRPPLLSSHTASGSHVDRLLRRQFECAHGICWPIYCDCGCHHVSCHLLSLMAFVMNPTHAC